ncbi:sigma-70 family RNA polymerase sigma factor [Actinophytocola sp.]|uniref:RNA polymerase sigma factor n=1 Tax=Actinophytocola sp. TaxID=1872138 RepID=UPI002ED6A531
MDDLEMARSFAADGEKAFNALHAAFRGPVFGIALHVLADPGLAEEATQMAFLGLWRSRDRYDPERSLPAWIFGITRKAAIDIYRRERRRPPTAEQVLEPAVDGHSIERLWEAWEVRRAVERLPEEEAVVARLAHYYQMTHSEIAEHLGIPVGTVKSRSYRAHRRLAEALQHLFDTADVTNQPEPGSMPAT